MAIRAFADFHRQFPESEYWVIGDGPERRPLEKLAQELGVGKNVIVWGAMPRSQVLEKLAELQCINSS